MPEINEIINRGFDYHQSGRLSEAECAYREALELDSDNAEVYNLMGVLKLQQNDTNASIEWVEKAIQLKPCEYFYETLFQAYIRSCSYEKIIYYENSIRKNYPKNFSLLFNMALAYKNLKQYKTAIKIYEEVLKIDPTSYQGWFNLAHLYEIEGQCKNAVSAMKICNKLKPHDEETEYFYSASLMRTKDYAKGLKYFESRISRKTALISQAKLQPHLATDKRLWKGENIKDKTIFVYYEAGFGDTIMFSRYLPILKKKCKKIVFYPQRPLVPLYTQSNLGIDELIDGYIPEKNMEYDVHAPLMSLPYLLKLSGNKVFESSEGYLFANSELKDEYKSKYFNNNDLKVGIKWQGNTYFDQDRVIPAEAFSPLIEVEGTKFYSFQTYEGSEDLKKLTDKYDIVDIGKDLIDFGQTAAALANLDLVICNDTSLAHLAGAMGIPCLVLLPYEVNWRWHEDLSHCDWYDSIRLFRQRSLGDWSSVFEQVEIALRNGVAKRNSIINSDENIAITV
ncbi:MAG: tetratricopeptide repeat protein [bacterium]|nr:tetratricopeptide repeat protein [bacterium]